MGIEAKYAYRFGYLKSEKWQIVRLEALVREKAKCQICTEESISNDAHHVWYPENIYDTGPEHLVILCRPCHDFLHAIMPKSKTKFRHIGKDTWLSFKAATIAWRMDKLNLFKAPELMEVTHARAIKEELNKIRSYVSNQTLGSSKTAKQKLREMFERIESLVSQPKP